MSVAQYQFVPGRCEDTERPLLTQWVVREPTMKMLNLMSEGCHSGHTFFLQDVQKLSIAKSRFQCLVSLMLSSQTRDEVIYQKSVFIIITNIITVVFIKVNFAAMERLKEHGLTIENLLNTSEEKLAELIKPVGFWRRKAQ